MQSTEHAIIGVCLLLVGSLTLLAAVEGDTTVADAAMRRDVSLVRSLVEDGADVNAAQGDGMTALHWAASNEDVGIAEMLLYAGANVQAKTRINSVTPLWMAAETGNPEVVKLLLEARSEVGVRSTTGVTPLMMASASGNVDAVRLLLDAGASVTDKEDTFGQTPLIFAAAFDRPEAVRILIEHGADPSVGTEVRSPTARARGGGGRGRGGAGNARGRGAGRGEAGDPALGLPVASADEEPAEPDEARAAVDELASQVETAEFEAPDEEESERLEPEAMGGLTPLLYAARQGHTDAVAALLDNGADVNGLSADRTSPLMMATINGHFDLAMFLLERGADPTIPTVAGATPLYRVLDVYWAPKSFYPQPETKQERVDYLELMTALLENGADPNARINRELWYTGYGFGLEGINPAGATPFWRAAQVGDVDAMRLLIAHGADPDLGTNEGISPLMVLAGAGYHGNDAITIPAGRMPGMRYLVEELGADVNQIDEIGGAATRIEHSNTRGYTAVHNAAARGDNEMILYLVSKGARVDLVGENGMTAVDMANGPRERIQPFPETIELLMGMGVKNSHRCVSC